MIKITNQSMCCGCTACTSICPHDAIQMQPDSLGFLYPVADATKCVDCGLCDSICRFKSGSRDNVGVMAYAARHKDPSQLHGSTSGAVFVALSDYIINIGGVVYGAAFDENFDVLHIRAEDQTERDRMRKSKYVQSSLGDTFRRVKDDLKDDRHVLFSGTPCQTDALRSYIGKHLSEKLYLVDIVCHGVPSPKVWKSYLEWLKEKFGSLPESVDFRNKKYGWRTKKHGESFVFSGKDYFSASFTHLFYSHFIHRESCGSCPYTNLTRPSDLTLADYWRKDKLCPDFAGDNMGCSLVISNSPKGGRLLDFISDSIIMEETEIEDCMQLNMEEPTKLNPLRFRFQKDFLEHGVEYVIKKYGDQSLGYRVRQTLNQMYYALRYRARKILGRV